MPHPDLGITGHDQEAFDLVTVKVIATGHARLCPGKKALPASPAFRRLEQRTARVGMTGKIARPLTGEQDGAVRVVQRNVERIRAMSSRNRYGFDT